MAAGDKPFYHAACGGNVRAFCIAAGWGLSPVVRPDRRHVLLIPLLLCRPRRLNAGNACPKLTHLPFGCEGSAMTNGTVNTQCCIAGGGPAGMMLGFLLARAGVRVVILEKHPDFLRDFRGDTVHPSTLELIYEVGLLGEFLRLPHRKVDRLALQIGKRLVRMIDMSHLPTRCKYIALMPQWDFLNFLADHCRRYRQFDLRMRAEATDLIEQDGRIVGVRANTPDGELIVRANLVVGADGRHSTLRAKAGLRSDDYGAPMDVLWFRMTRREDDGEDVFGHIEAGAMIVMLDRGDYWQCAYVIPKGGIERVKSAGIEAFRARVVALSPFLADRIGEIRSFDDVKLLSVTVDRLQQWWRPGLICIGDAAHAMSPIGGVGINIAVQDAVAAANRLAAPLRNGSVTDDDLRAIQVRRAFPARLTQQIQLAMQNRIIGPALQGTREPEPPFLFRLFNAFPILRRMPARLLAVGIRPEHVQTPDAADGGAV
jgi:2-polyprenyl-6-methoxyphenol hydroxylase-like FAD-dependent oxidoreductase